MIGPDVEVIVEATGHAPAGIAHARAAIAAGKHIVMVNVEADVLAGPLLAREARKAGVVYSLAYGDQPALICEWSTGRAPAAFRVIAAGKGTKYLPEYHASTPRNGLGPLRPDAGEAQSGGMNPQMFNSFLDGTKSGIEMAAVANATGLDVPRRTACCFRPAASTTWPHVLRPANGGVLHHPARWRCLQLQRDGRPVFNDLRWGVYVVFEAPNDYAAAASRNTA
jgi:predicted homoserine dehydrogenase-like protein